jgi:hypothetical protein
MVIEIGLWKMVAQLEPVRFQPREDDKKLEAALASDLSLVGEALLLIKRQVVSASGKLIDMLAVVEVERVELTIDTDLRR